MISGSVLLANLDGLALIPCVLSGLAAAVFVVWVLMALSSEDAPQEAEWRYDVSRINALRRSDATYRLLQPLLRPLARLNRAAFERSLPEVQRELLAAGLSRYWLPEEYLARMELHALLLMPALIYVSVSMMGPPGIVTGVMLTGFAAWMFRRGLARAAKRRVLIIKRRLPFLLDLLTLLMEAGASFLNALHEAVREFGDHPIGVEFGRVLADLNMGKVRTEAFENLRHRLGDDEISSIVGSILQSEQLGTPLAQIFRTQADILRVKRSQRAETIANEAGVQMLLPAVLVMAATVIIILGPFLLSYVYSGLGL